MLCHRLPCCFGADVVRRFLRANGLRSIASRYALCAQGFQILFAGTCVTVWSAPNYCYRCGNTAAILEVDDDLVAAGCRPLPRHFNTFTATGCGSA
eukprot:gene16262-304_t